MAAKIPAHAVVASFRFERAAGDALKKIHEIAKKEGLGIHNAAVLTVSEDGKLHIKETDDMTGRKGAVVGGVVGGVVGILGSTVLLPLGVGAAVGGLAAKLRDSGFPNQRLQDIGSRVQPGDSLLILAVDESAVAPVSRILQHAGAEVVKEAIDGKVAEELEAASEQPEGSATAAPAEPPPSA
jgi:uncharacterized membrane protein